MPAEAPRNRFQKKKPLSEKYAKTRTPRCNTCRHRLLPCHESEAMGPRRRRRRIAASTILPRMTTLLLLCYYLGMSTSPLCTGAAVVVAASTKVASSMQNNINVHDEGVIIDADSVAGAGGGRGEDDDNDDFDYFDDDEDILEDDDYILDDILLSDYDNSLDIVGEDEEIQKERLHHPKLKVTSPDTDGRRDDDDRQRPHSGKESEGEDSVIILSAVDGTLAGISRTSGRVLWKQSKDNIVTHDHSNTQGGGKEESSPSQDVPVPPHPLEWDKFLSPLVSTTTSTKVKSSEKNLHNNMQNHRQWHAVPSIDGTVYLTSGEDSATGRELGMVTDIRDLVDRAPFVDANQRFFVGSRRAMVAAVDERTGEILRVIPKWKGGGGGDDDDKNNMPPSLEGRDVVWIGRLEHTVTVHDLHKGTVDIEFSVAEILSVDEMIHGTDNRGDNAKGVDDEEDTDLIEQREMEVERLFTDYITEALRHPSDGDRILRLPAPEEEGFDDEEEEDVYNSGRRSGSSSMSRQGGLPFLVSTPSGNVAFRDSDSSSTGVGWVSFDMLDSPVVYAIEASSGHKIRVNMLPDDASAVSPPGNAAVGAGERLNGKEGGLPLLLLEQQIASLKQSSLLSTGILDESCDGSESGECRAVGFGAQRPVVGALENGHIYALPLGERISRPSSQQFPLGLPQPGHHHTIAAENAAYEYHMQAAKLNTHHAIGFHEHRHDSSDGVDAGDKAPIHLDAKNKQSCTPSSPLYPGCLIGASLMLGNLLDVDGNLDMASVFASSDLDFDLYLDMLEQGNKKNKNSLFQQFVKIMSSWIAPTVALLFVVSFEIGRRERIKAEAADTTESSPSSDNEKDATTTEETSKNKEVLNTISNSLQNGVHQNNGGGVIQLSDEILGYGGHGTIVYRGVLERRDVAVKRLLSTYHASADREISLLIESDGHPNVVRYFLKEMRGDFVYLALELCDMSLNDLIVSLSKLRAVRKENFQFHHEGSGSEKDGFESATKSLLFQIASGVRHIHSLRIVHRDLKPQNILLALRGGKSKSLAAKSEESSDSDTEIDDTTHSACSDTNSILESFKNQEYVPKISDMGLGKQLAGQSSFGLSTLGTGSVGGGDGGGGPGAGSVGWQAPEVMAMRWSPELSSNMNTEASSSELLNMDGSEASPLEASGSNVRTSRSVDIFSLGCIFYCTILPGSHPFGEWYEREANIMKNSPNKDDLEFVSPDASDLILSMIHRDARARPTAEEVCEHPFFWSLSRRLKFLCELSDRIEFSDATATASTLSSPHQKGKKSAESSGPSPSMNIFAIEKGAVEIFGTSWEKKLDPELVEASSSRRTYDPSSVRDCLRMMRNKHHHYDELPAKVKSRIGSSTNGLSSYIMRSFPRLLMHCYHFCVANLALDDPLALDYKLPISRYLSLHSSKSKQVMKKGVIADLSVLNDAKNSCPQLETIPDDGEVEQEQQDDDIVSTNSNLEDGSGLPITKLSELSEYPSPEVEEALTQTIERIKCIPSKNDDLSGIVVWSGSNTAKELNCRGWFRSDDEWMQRIDAKLRSKRDTNLALRCADDPKFRTRLCNHWDVSGGTFCPMRKKNKCIFAHGPVELRVKEGKRKRWGTLVNKNTGLCANPRASGGEDTYGAARSIEKTRKEQGEWKVDSTVLKKHGKGKPNKGGKQQSSKKKKEQKSS